MGFNSGFKGLNINTFAPGPSVNLLNCCQSILTKSGIYSYLLREPNLVHDFVATSEHNIR